MPIFLQERLSFDKLFRYSEPKRVYRSFTVRGPPLEIDGYQDAEYYIFNFKANPSTTGLRHRGYIKFFRPLHKNPKDVPLQHLECLVDCMCFAGDTLVLMSDGRYKPISEIRDGDYVYTHKGRIRKVIGNVERKQSSKEKVFKFRVAGFPLPIVATGNHPFYAFRGNLTCRCGCGQEIKENRGRVNPTPTSIDRQYCPGHARNSELRISNETIAAVSEESRSGEFTLKQLVARHRISKGSVYNIQQSILKPFVPIPDEDKFHWIKVKDFRKREWFLTPWLEDGGAESLEADLARFLGYYAAEGCFGRKGVRTARINFTLHIDEEDTLAKDISQIADKFFAEGDYFRLPQPWRGEQGDVVSVRRQDGLERKRPQQCVSVACSATKEFQDFITEHIGCGSHEKRLSARFMRLDNASLKQFLTGLFLGDGHVKEDGSFRWTSVSNDLVWQVSTILNRLKVKHVITNLGDSYGIDINEGSSARAVFSWLRNYLREDVKLRACVKDEKTSYSKDEGYLRVLSKYEESDYDGTVWDLCVEEDHSFIVHGVAVANCPDYRYRWAWANKQRGSSLVGPQSLNQAWNKAPRITNPQGNVGLCKHILAAREYIYGLLSSFPGDEKDSAYKLDRLTKHATKRWTDFEGQMRAAKVKELEIRKRRQMRNIGQDPDKPVQPVPTEPTEPLEIGVDEPLDIPVNKKTTVAPEEVPSPELAKPPGARGRQLPKAQPTPALAVPPGLRGRSFPTTSEKPTPPKSKRVIGNRKISPINSSKHGWIRPQEAYLCAPIRNLILESVFNLNGDTMSMIKDAIKLVEEMEEDELNRFDPESRPSDIGMDGDSGGGGGDIGGDSFDGMGIEDVDGASLEPSEPPISDTAMGADTEGESALSLLRSIKVSLEQIAAAVAPIEEVLPGGPGGPGGAEGAEGGGGEIPMPDEPPIDVNAKELEQDGEEDEEAAVEDDEAAVEDEDEEEESHEA